MRDPADPLVCGCGLDDCELLDFGYPYCSGCGEHHRGPVPTEAEPWCAVDFNAALLDEADRRGEGTVSDETRRIVRERFAAALSRS